MLTTSLPLFASSRVRFHNILSRSTSIVARWTEANVISSLGVKAKVENPDQYKQYLESLESLRVELGVALREELYPQEA